MDSFQRSFSKQAPPLCEEQMINSYTYTSDLETTTCWSSAVLAAAAAAGAAAIATTTTKHMMSATTSLFDIMELRFKELIDMISPVAAADDDSSVV